MLLQHLLNISSFSFKQASRLIRRWLITLSMILCSIPYRMSNRCCFSSLTFWSWLIDIIGRCHILWSTELMSGLFDLLVVCVYREWWWAAAAGGDCVVHWLRWWWWWLRELDDRQHQATSTMLFLSPAAEPCSWHNAWWSTHTSSRSRLCICAQINRRLRHHRHVPHEGNCQGSLSSKPRQ